MGIGPGSIAHGNSQSNRAMRRVLARSRIFFDAFMTSSAFFKRCSFLMSCSVFVCREGGRLLLFGHKKARKDCTLKGEPTICAPTEATDSKFAIVSRLINIEPLELLGPSMRPLRACIPPNQTRDPKAEGAGDVYIGLLDTLLIGAQMDHCEKWGLSQVGRHFTLQG